MEGLAEEDDRDIELKAAPPHTTHRPVGSSGGFHGHLHHQQSRRRSSTGDASSLLVVPETDVLGNAGNGNGDGDDGDDHKRRPSFDMMNDGTSTGGKQRLSVDVAL
jgi:hypothetical protein